MRSVEHCIFTEAPGLDQLERVNIDTLLLDARGLGAHRAWRDAADIGVMPARRHEEQNLGAAFGEHRGHHGDVGKMRAAVIGRVQHPHIAGREIAADLAPHGLDAAVHRAEMHRDMRGVGDEPAVAIEDGAGEVEPLLDVDRARGVLQRIAHLLGNRGEALVEHFEQHWIDAGAERGPRFAFAHAGEQQMVLRRDLCLPVRLDHDGLMRLDDEGRAQDAMAWLETGAQENWRVVPGATGEEPRHGLRFRKLVDRKRHVWLMRMVAAAKRLDLDRLDLDWLVRTRKAEALAVHRLEHVFELGKSAEWNRQRAVSAEIAEMRQHADADAGARNALALQLLLGIIGERRSQGFRGSQAVRIERAQDGATRVAFSSAKPHAVG